MDVVKLINCSFCKVEYLGEFNTMHIMFKGKVMKDQMIKMRNMLDGLSESLKIKKLILDFTKCDQAYFDYNSHSRIAFWKNLYAHGLSKTLLIIHPKNFVDNAISAWKSFFSSNQLDIKVSAISNRKLMPYFIS